MNKMVIGLTAALAAGIAFGVESDIVGYGKTALLNGTKVVGGTFNSMKTKEGCYLTELMPDGYKTVSFFMEKKRSGKYGVRGDFIITFINPDGTVATDPKSGDSMTYKFWNAYTVANGWADDAHWTGDSGEITSDNDIFIPNGSAFLFDCDTAPYDYEEEQGNPPPSFTLLCNGGAMVDSQAVPVINGTKPVSAPLSKGVKLTQILPRGYETVSFFMEKKRSGKYGVRGDFIITFINPDGTVATDPKSGDSMMYKFWNAYTVANGWADDAHWTGDSGEITADNDVDLPFGCGVLFDCDTAPYDYEEEQGNPPPEFTVEFPGIDDTYASEK